MCTTRIFGALLGAALTAFSGLAQEGTWRHFRTLEEVNEVAETATDLWLATKHGAVRVDKASHESTWYLPNNSALAREHVSSVAVEPATGITWIGTYDVILMRWDGTDFVQEPLPADIVAGLQQFEGKLLKVAFAPNGDLWLGTSAGVVMRSGSTWTWFDDQFFSDLGITFGAVWDISFDEMGNTFLASHELVRRDVQGNFHDVNGDDFTLFSYNEAHVETRGNRTFFMGDMGGIGIYEGDSTLLVSDIVQMTGLVTCNPQSSAFVKAPGNDVLLKMPDSELVYKFEDLTLVPVEEDVITEASHRPDQVWTTTDGTKWAAKADFLWWQQGSNAAEEKRMSNQIMSQQVMGVEQAENGKIYVLSGYNFLDPSVFSVYDYATNEWTYQQGPVGATTIQKDPQGHIWAAGGNKLYRLDDDIWTDVTATINTPAEIQSTYIYSVNGDDIWITTDYKLYHYDGSAWTIFTSANSDLYYQGHIQKILARNDGGCYVMQYKYAEQAYVLHTIDAEGNFTTISLLSELDVYYFTDMALAADGSLWAADFYKLHHLDGNTWTSYGTDQGWTAYYPFDIAFAPDGRLVAGLASEGLVIFNNGDISYLNPNNSELSGGQIIRVGTDNLNTIWAGVENVGLDAYSINNFEPSSTDNLTAMPGLLSAQPNPTDGPTTLRWKQEAAASQVSITIFDVQGRRLQHVALGGSPAGEHTLPIDLGARAAGLYTAQIILDGQVSATVLVKK